MSSKRRNRSWASHKAKRQKVLKYVLKLLCENLVPVDEKVILEKASRVLDIDEKEIRNYLDEGIAKGIFQVIDKGIRCEHCLEDISLKDIRRLICEDISDIKDIIGIKIHCIYCNNDFIVTEEHIYKYYKLTYRSLDRCKELEMVRSMVPEMKLLGYLADKKLRQLKEKGLEKPFKRYYFIIVLHFLRDLIPLTKELIKFGAEPSKMYFLCKPYPYAYKDKIKFFLVGEGCNVYIASSIKDLEKRVISVLNEIKQKVESERRKFIIVEDGGYVVPCLHKKFSEIIGYCKGAVEQTTKGVTRDKRLDIKIPVLSVAECEFKRRYEPRFVGDAVVRNIWDMLPDERFEGRIAILVGYGTIGPEIAKRLRDVLRMIVYVVEERAERRDEARAQGFQVFKDVRSCLERSECMDRCMLIVGTTGRTSIGKDEIAKLPHNVILVSASSDRDEIDVDELELLAASNKEPLYSSRDRQKIGTVYELVRLDPPRKVTLLADGYPVNFYYSESVPNKSFDPILTILFLATLELAIRRDLNPGVDKNIVDDIVEREQVVKEMERLYRLV